MTAATPAAAAAHVPPGGVLTPEELAARLGLHAPTPEQSRVIAHPLTPLLVVAGAGSGKTATMSQRVVHLVARGEVRPDQVLGLTFTRKATAELAERVGARLSGLVRGQDTGYTGLLDGSGGPGPAAVAPADTADAWADDAPEPTIATYNAFAGSIVRDHGLRIGVDPDSVLITEARAWQVVSALVESRTEPLADDAPTGRTSVTESVLRLDASLSENLLGVEEAADRMGELSALFDGLASLRGCKERMTKARTTMDARRALLELVRDYREHKRRHGLIDFGDQIALACRIAEEVPEAAAQLRSQYPAVLLDEFQDTSVAQVRLLSALFAGSGVTAVGDPHQAIYGWRGASAGALDTFHARFNPAGTAAVEHVRSTGAQGEELEAAVAHHTPVLPLSTAWRNDTAVLEAANAVSLPLRSDVRQDGDAPVEHIPVEPLRPRPVGAGLAAGLVAGAYLNDQREEADTVAAFLEERWSPSAEMAVLCRTRAQFGPVAEALEARGLPVTVADLGGMLTVPEVADVRALLTVAADPERGDRLMRLLTGAGIGATDLRALSRLSREIVRVPAAPVGSPSAARQAARPGSPGPAQEEDRDEPLLSEALETLARWQEDGSNRDVPGLMPSGRLVALRLARQVRRVRRALALPVPDLVVLVEQVLGLDIELAARVGNPLGRRALDDLRATAERFAAEVEAPSAGAFLDWLDVVEVRENGLDAPDVEPEPGAVQVLTIHAAKGLEWDVVAVTGMVEKVFPSYGPGVREDRTLAEGGWLSKRGEFPHPLRADAGTLPPFLLELVDPTDAGAVKDEWSRYSLALGRHLVAEERRLAYVALTRARHDLLLTGSYFSGTAKTPRPVSRFLDELHRRDLVTPYGAGFTELAEDAQNPARGEVRTGAWPSPAPQGPAGERYRARMAAALAVTEAARAHGGEAERGSAVGAPVAGPDDDVLVARWRTEVDLLLAEREQDASEGPTVRLPEHLAATRVDDLRSDPAAFALDLRRPLPPEPRAAGRLGTVFHELVAQRLATRATLFDLSAAGVPDSLSAADRAQVERWLETAESLPLIAGCELVAVEVDRELTLGGVTIRCRIDAVLRRPDGTWLVVDWKTGHRRVPVDQLSLYVHAWAASEGVGADAVTAAYVYVDDAVVDQLTPADLLSLEDLTRLLASPGVSA